METDWLLFMDILDILIQSSACISFVIWQAVVIARQALDAAAVDNRYLTKLTLTILKLVLTIRSYVYEWTFSMNLTATRKYYQTHMIHGLLLSSSYLNIWLSTAILLSDVNVMIIVIVFVRLYLLLLG